MKGTMMRRWGWGGIEETKEHAVFLGSAAKQTTVKKIHKNCTWYYNSDLQSLMILFLSLSYLLMSFDPYLEFSAVLNYIPKEGKKKPFDLF